MPNIIADPSKYPTRSPALGTELVHTRDPALPMASSDVLLSVDTLAARARLVPVRTAAGTTDSLLAADAGGAIHYTNASAITVTIPTNATTAIPVGTTVLLRQYGAGAVAVSAASGVTLRNGQATAKTAGQYKGSIALHKVATDEWYLDGSVAAS